MTVEFVKAIVLPWLSAFVLAFLAALVPLAYWKGFAFLKQRQIDTTVYEALGRAGGVAYTYLLTSGHRASDPEAIRLAAKAGAEYLESTVKDAMEAKGVVGPEELAKRAGAELGKLLALDVNVQPAA